MKVPIPDITRDLFDLSGYCSIVTGVSAGIGLTIAESLARRGSDLVLVSRNAEHLDDAARKVKKETGSGASLAPTGPTQTGAREPVTVWSATRSPCPASRSTAGT